MFVNRNVAKLLTDTQICDTKTSIFFYSINRNHNSPFFVFCKIAGPYKLLNLKTRCK